MRVQVCRLVFPILSCSICSIERSSRIASICSGLLLVDCSSSCRWLLLSLLQSGFEGLPSSLRLRGFCGTLRRCLLLCLSAPDIAERFVCAVCLFRGCGRVAQYGFASPWLCGWYCLLSGSERIEAQPPKVGGGGFKPYPPPHHQKPHSLFV